MNNIFITYNENCDRERTLAVRMHMIGAVHGIRTYLPDRTENKFISDETKARIQKCDWMFYFCLGKLSSQIKTEIEYAYDCFSRKGRIIIIHDASCSKKAFLELRHQALLWSLSSESNIFESLPAVFSELKDANRKLFMQQRKNREILLAFMIVGIGFFVLALILRNDMKKSYGNKRRQAAQRRY